MIELVVFDLGRVLIRICNNYREACALAGIQVPHDRPYADDDPATAALDHEAVVQLDTGRIDLTEFARRVSATRGIPPEHVIRAYDLFLREPYAGAVELIDDIHAAGLRTACLSNTSNGHWRQMNDPSHSSFFPLQRLTWRFASHLIGACKPADTIYEHVERTTELPPGSTLFFDDLEDNVAAARKRGWNAHVIRLDADPIAQIREHLRAAGVLLNASGPFA